jgi:hypothetical protein
MPNDEAHQRGELSDQKPPPFTAVQCSSRVGRFAGLCDFVELPPQRVCGAGTTRVRIGLR